MLPEANNTVNTMVFRFQRTKFIGICSIFSSNGFTYTRKHRLYDDFKGRKKCDNKLCCHLQQEEEEEEEEVEKEQHEEEEEEEAEEKHTQNFDKKMCRLMLTSCGLTRTSHCALRLLTSRAYEQQPL